MSKEILITLRSEDRATKKIKNTEKAVTNLGKKVKMSSLSQAKSLQDVTQTLDALGNRFRYLSLVAGMAAGAMVLMAKNLVDSAVEAEAATVRLGAYAQISGQGFDQANEVALKFARTGLMSVTESFNTLSNLLATGINLDTADELMQGMLDTAVLSKEILQDTFGQALEKSSLGVRILQERQVDAIGINFRSDQVWRAYGKTIGKTTAQMSTQEKQLAVINFLLKETKKFTGGAEIAADTFGGTLSKLSANLFQTKAALGTTLIPVLGPFVELLIKASDKVRSFAKEMPALSMVMISGSVAVVVFVTALATAGALLPMIAKGAQFSAAALKMLSVSAMITGLKFIALAVAVGTLIYLVAKATGQWDKWSNSIKNLQKRIADTISPTQKLNEEIADPAVAKKLKKIQEQMMLTTRSFKEGMREWVEKHDKTVRELTKQINKLEREYTKAVNKIRDNFKDSQEDQSLAHQRKVEDLEREIEEEVSKGLWADQTKIRNLERELRREHEDYDIAQEQNEQRRKEDLTDAKDKYSERLSALKKELDDALALEKKHSDLVAKARTWPLLNQIEKQQRQHDERIKQLKDELAEVNANMTGQIGAHSEIAASLGNILESDNVVQRNNKSITDKIIDSWSGVRNKIESIAEKISRINWYSVGEKIRHYIGSALEAVYRKFKEFVEYVTTFGRHKPKAVHPGVSETLTMSTVYKTLQGNLTGFKNFLKGLIGYQHGGIVPGPIGQPVPIMAHAGETVIPANQSPITININNPTVRNESDINSIANAVEDVLSRRTFLKTLK